MSLPAALQDCEHTCQELGNRLKTLLDEQHIQIL